MGKLIGMTRSTLLLVKIKKKKKKNQDRLPRCGQATISMRSHNFQLLLGVCKTV